MGEVPQPQNDMGPPQPAPQPVEHGPDAPALIEIAHDKIRHIELLLDHIAFDYLKSGDNETAKIYYARIGRRALLEKFHIDFADESVPPKK